MAFTGISHRQNDAAAALTAANAAQSTADSAASAASAAQSDATSALADAAAAQSDADAAQSTANTATTNIQKTGLPLRLLGSMIGNGSAASTLFGSLPISPTNGEKYGFRGTMNVLKTSDHSVLRSIELTGCQLTYVGDAWSLHAPGNYQNVKNDSGDIASYITAGPALGVDGASLGIGYTGVNLAEFDLDIDLEMSSLGSITPS